MTFERAEHSGSCLYDLPPSDYSCSREQFPSSIIGRGSKTLVKMNFLDMLSIIVSHRYTGEVLSTLRLSKNTLMRAMRAIVGKMHAV